MDGAAVIAALLHGRLSPLATRATYWQAFRSPQARLAAEDEPGVTAV
jgi:hypothetical protein